MESAPYIDLGEFIDFQDHLLKTVQDHSIPQVADTHKRIILNLTDQGYDANEETFHDYSEEYAIVRTKEGYAIHPVDLRKTGGLLNSLDLYGDTLTVDDDHQAVALGQMTGASGKWGYERDFLDVSDTTNETASEDLAEFLQLTL